MGTITKMEEIRQKLKFAGDEDLSAGTRAFFNSSMTGIMQFVDAEFSAVLGEFWADFKA